MRVTEERNPNSVGIDTKSTVEILHIINEEDKKVAFAVEHAIPEIAATVERVTEVLAAGGRLFYIGAGTSGRLGVLDASECHPTFGVPYDKVQGIIAGGNKALTMSVEGAEDHGEEAVAEMKRRCFSSCDALIGITANGGAKFVVEALKYASALNAFTAAISSNPDTEVFDVIDPKYRIYLPVGAEIITGSTRMKSGTAQKMTLNMITTATMIKLGKVYNNLMVDVLPLNAKLVTRSINMIKLITGCSDKEAEDVFSASGNDTRLAIVMAATESGKEYAQELLLKYKTIGNIFLSQKKLRLNEEFK